MANELIIWPIADWLADPGVSVPFGLGRGGIAAGLIVPPFPFGTGAAFDVDVRTGMGFYWNVLAWTLQSIGNLTIVFNGPTQTGTLTGPINLTIPAVNYLSDGSLAAPELGGLSLHGGWYGHADSAPGWTFASAGGGTPESIDTGEIWFRLGESTSEPGNFPDGRLVFAPLAQLPGCNVGKNSDSDNCEVTSTFLPMGGGPDTGFTFKLGSAPAPFDLPPTFTGSLTLNPTSLISYPP